MKIEKEITVKIKNVFGNRLIYPICKNAKIFTELTKSKTLSNFAIDKIKNLGFKIVVQSEAL